MVLLLLLGGACKAERRQHHVLDLAAQLLSRAVSRRRQPSSGRPTLLDARLHPFVLLLLRLPLRLSPRLPAGKILDEPQRALPALRFVEIREF